MSLKDSLADRFGTQFGTAVNVITVADTIYTHGIPQKLANRFTDSEAVALMDEIQKRLNEAGNVLAAEEHGIDPEQLKQFKRAHEDFSSQLTDIGSMTRAQSDRNVMHARMKYNLRVPHTRDEQKRMMLQVRTKVETLVVKVMSASEAGKAAKGLKFVDEEEYPPEDEGAMSRLAATTSWIWGKFSFGSSSKQPANPDVEMGVPTDETRTQTDETRAESPTSTTLTTGGELHVKIATMPAAASGGDEDPSSCRIGVFIEHGDRQYMIVDPRIKSLSDAQSIASKEGLKVAAEIGLELAQSRRLSDGIHRYVYGSMMRRNTISEAAESAYEGCD